MFRALTGVTLCLSHAALVAVVDVAPAAASRLRFGPALNADPGAGSPFSNPESEFDGEAGVECPYPPCRPLRDQLTTRRDHDDMLRATQRNVERGGKQPAADEQAEWPPRVNVVIGGPDCRTCNAVLLGERLNPGNLQRMRTAMAHWEEVTDSMIEERPKDAPLKRHAIHVAECFHAFDRLACVVDDDASDALGRGEDPPNRWVESVKNGHPST